jgi:hypothetical protein
VTFDTKEQLYIFNGSKCRMSGVACSVTSEIFDSDVFPVLESLTEGQPHAVAERTSSSKSCGINSWRNDVTVATAIEQSHANKTPILPLSTESSTDFVALLGSCSSINSNDTKAASGTPSMTDIAGTSTCTAETHDGRQQSVAHSCSLMSYGPDFSKVDLFGLTASAAKTAEWELRNSVPAQRGTTSTRNNKHQIQSEQQDNSGQIASDPSSSKAVPATMNECEALLDFDQLLSSDDAKLTMPALQQFPRDFAATRNTMKQHAKNKGKSKWLKSTGRSNAKKVIAILELPEPRPTKRKPASKIDSLKHSQDEPSYCGEEEPSKVDALLHGTSGPASQLESLSFVQQVQKRVHCKHGPCSSDDDDDHGGESDVLVKADMKITGDIGTLLIIPSKNADQLFQADAPSKLADLLNCDEQTRETSLLSRITASSIDAELLVKMLPASFKLAGKETVYEFCLKTANGFEEISFNPAAAGGDRSYHRPRLARDQGIQYLHFAGRVWDARIRVATTTTHDPLAAEVDAAILQFLKSLKTDGSPPSITGTCDIRVFVPEEVLAKRVLTYTDGDVSFVVTEVQDLQVAIRASQTFNFRAQGLPRKQMIKDQRLWVEARFETNSLEQLPVLQRHLASLVTVMDNIGASNRGPSCFEST